MFELHEAKLRELLADDDSDTGITAFDPMKVDADELHRFVDDALFHEVIGREDSATTISVYPLSLSEPEPVLAVGTGASIVLGSSVDFRVAEREKDAIEGTILVVRSIVEDANGLYRASTKDERAEWAGLEAQCPCRGGGGMGPRRNLQ